jgi:hypothetical protein
MVGKLVGKHPEITGDVQGLYVRGSALLWIPSARMNEVRSVVREQHRREAELAIPLAMVGRR